MDATEMPTDLDKASAFLAEWSPATRVALDESAGWASEGIVLRTPDRSVIARACFQDYARTLKRRR